MDNQISHYKIISKIASGGMANVFLAQDTTTNTKVAIKILKEEVSAKEKILERFTQEGLLNLNHPNIVKILDAGVHENTPYIVMEYIEGRDLEALIKDKKRLSVHEALSIFSQLLSALSYVHSFGIIHRDIKPKNILIDKSGKVKLTDFGIAKSLYSHVKTSTGGYLGAPAYSSPEQMDGLALDNRSDIYSLGITLYEMLSGITPFSSTSIPNLIKEKFTGNYRQIGTYRSDVSPYIISVIEKCIAVNPKDRFGSISEIMDALSNSNNSGTVIIASKSKQAISIKKLTTVFSIITAIMLVVIIILSVNLTAKNSQILNYEDMIASLTNTQNNSSSNTTKLLTEDTTKTTTANAQTTIQNEAQAAAETTAAAAETTASQTTSSSDYNIGDTGPAGGLIFYINPNYQSDGWKYLEAAPTDFLGSNNDYWIQWDYREYGNNPVTGATQTAIGTGKANTQKIVDIQGSGNYAAKLCDDLILNGYDDWFMPSKDELNLMYKNLHLSLFGGFASDDYWSSSEYDAGGAWLQLFGSGEQYNSNKTNYRRVRALRAF